MVSGPAASVIRGSLLAAQNLRPWPRSTEPESLLNGPHRWWDCASNLRSAALDLLSWGAHLRQVLFLVGNGMRNKNLNRATNINPENVKILVGIENKLVKWMFINVNIPSTVVKRQVLEQSSSNYEVRNFNRTNHCALHPSPTCFQSLLKMPHGSFGRISSQICSGNYTRTSSPSLSFEMQAWGLEQAAGSTSEPRRKRS